MKPSQPVPVGIATILSIGSALAAGVGAIIAAVAGNDPATFSAAAASTIAVLVGAGGRYAQAIATIKAAALVAEPWIDAAQDALDEPGNDAMLGDHGIPVEDLDELR